MEAAEERTKRPRLYLHNVPFRASKQDICEWVGRVATALSVEIPTYTDTGWVRGYAYVNVRLEDGLTIEEVADALNGTQMPDPGRKDESRTIEVQVARPDPRDLRRR